MNREEVIQMLESGVSLKKISDTLGINYNTVRQVSVSNNLLKKFSYLDEKKINRLKELGNNIRALAPIKEDKEAINMVVEYIEMESKVTRQDLEDLVNDILDIKEHSAILVENYNYSIECIEEKIGFIKSRIQRINNIEGVKKDLELQFKYIRELKDKELKMGYLNLVGLKCTDDRLYYSLARIVNINLWNRLRRAEAIVPGTNEILDMEKFIALTKNIMKKNNYFKNAEKVDNVLTINRMTVDKQLEPYLLDLNNEIVNYNEKIDELRNKMKEASKDAINNYFAERELRNEFTKNDSITHAKIQQGGAKWLFNKGYVSTIELPADKFKFDVIAYNREEEIVILEAKANYSDLIGDKKIEKYMKYCDKLYLVSNDGYICDAGVDVLDKRIGVIKLNNAFAFQDVLREAENLNNGKKELIYEINRKNSRKLIY